MDIKVIENKQEVLLPAVGTLFRIKNGSGSVCMVIPEENPHKIWKNDSKTAIYIICIQAKGEDMELGQIYSIYNEKLQEIEILEPVSSPILFRVKSP